MYILIAVAMECEATPLIEKLENDSIKVIHGYTFHIGKINNKNVIIGISNIGIINMSSMISIAIMKFDINIILNYGLSGGYGNIHKGQIIVGKECININSYITKKDKKININNINLASFYNKNNEISIYKADNNLLNIIKSIDNNIIYGRIGSGDVWNKEEEKINFLYNNYNVLCEDMESIAVYQVSNKFNIPSISIRIISNNEILNEEYDDTIINDLVKSIIKFINTLSI